MAQALLSRSPARSLIEVDELRTQAEQLVTAEAELLDRSAERLRDRAATKAAVRLARPLLECGVQVVFLDYLGSRFSGTYREELTGVADLLIVRLDVDGAAHRARNRSRPTRRHYPPDTLAFLRASARREDRDDHVIDTSNRPPGQTARELDELLRA